MKHLIIVLFLALVSCKKETTANSQIDQSVYTMWNNFTKANPELKITEMPESWYFHNNKEDANRLAKLTLIGKKSAASGLYSWYKEANADLPKIGTKHIITNFDGKAQAIIKIVKVDTIPFNKITSDYAQLDMGTSAEPLKKWKKAHWDFFTTAMAENGKKPSEDMLVVCETFKTIWKK